GLVLNRQTPSNLKQVWQEVVEAECARDDLIYLGGPVSGPLMAVHTLPSASDLDVIEGMYFTAGADDLRELAAQAEPRARFFIGHAGWGPGQLEGELEGGSWLTGQATIEAVFSSPDDLWLRMTKQLVGSSLITALNIKHVPPNPNLN
ncbi:MAG: YqgE/AlgH family protein, partial [Planctomycetaceae bacterium]|nr:YqgE/AlgH family protein [Planctomycetaceae bacterium]